MKNKINYQELFLSFFILVGIIGGYFRGGKDQLKDCGISSGTNRTFPSQGLGIYSTFLAGPCPAFVPKGFQP